MVSRYQDIKSIVGLAGPLILTNLLYVAIATIDLIMLGFLSPLDLAAGGLAIAIFNQFRTMGTGLVTATGNLVSYAQGEQNNERIQALLNASLLLSTVTGVFFALLMLGVKPLLILFGTEVELAAKTSQYLLIAALGLLPCFWFQSLRHFSVGLKAPGPLLIITCLSVVFTVFLNYGFIFGRFGLPMLGFIGVALATVIVLFLSLLFFLFFAFRHSSLRPFLSWQCWRQNKKALQDTWKMGLPIAATYGSEAGFFTVLTLVVAQLGVIELAAHTVVTQVVYIVFMISAGISSAASIYISEACARNNLAHVGNIGNTSLVLGGVVMTIMMLIYLLYPELVLAVFLHTEMSQQKHLIEMTVSILFIAAFLQFFDASQNIGIGLLRGLGDVKTAFKFSLYGYWLFGLPIAFLLSSYFKLGLVGVWYGLAIGLLFTASFLLFSFRKQLRQRLLLANSVAN